MYVVEIVGLVLFIALMAVGYKKNNRNIMLLASLCLLVAVAGPDFVSGVMDGLNAQAES